MVIQRCVQAWPCGVTRRGPGHDDEIEAVYGAAQLSEPFAGESLQTITQNGRGHLPLGNRKTKPGARTLRCPGEDSEVAVSGPTRLCEDMFELGGLQQTRRTRKPMRGNRCGLFRLPRLPAYCGVSRTRPLARRALITLRPPRVAMRARKPWLRALLRRLGWNVRFMTVWIREANRRLITAPLPSCYGVAAGSACKTKGGACYRTSRQHVNASGRRRRLTRADRALAQSRGGAIVSVYLLTINRPELVVVNKEHPCG